MPASSRRLTAAALLSVVLFGASVLAAIGQLGWSDRIRIYGGCGWDGYFYCAMLKDAVVPEPFSRRILLPFLAKHISTGGLAGFWVVNIASLAGATAVAMYVAWRLRAVATAGAPRTWAVAPPLLVGATFLSARNSFHLVATYPALTDALALLLLVGAVAFVALPVSWSSRLVLVPVCFLAPLAREQLAAVLLLGVLLAGLMRLLPWAVSLGAAGAAVAGGLYAFSRPHSGGGQSLSETIRTWVDQDFGSWNGFLRFGLMVLLALGPFVLAAVALHAELESSKPALWIVAVAAIFTGISVFAGGDTDRILTPAGLLLGLAVVVAGSGTEAGLLGLGLLVAAYAVQQEPIRSVSGEPQAWLSFFGLRVTTTSSVIGNGLVPTIVALPLTVGGIIVLLLGRRPNHLASPPATALPGRKAAQ